jgi:hypothetical protein
MEKGESGTALNLAGNAIRSPDVLSDGQNTTMTGVLVALAN